MGWETSRPHANKEQGRKMNDLSWASQWPNNNPQKGAHVQRKNRKREMRSTIDCAKLGYVSACHWRHLTQENKQINKLTKRNDPQILSFSLFVSFSFIYEFLSYFASFSFRNERRQKGRIRPIVGLLDLSSSPRRTNFQLAAFLPEVRLEAVTLWIRRWNIIRP